MCRWLVVRTRRTSKKRHVKKRISNIESSIQNSPIQGYACRARIARPACRRRAKAGGNEVEGAKTARFGPLKPAENRLRPPSPALAHIDFLCGKSKTPGIREGNDRQGNRGKRSLEPVREMEWCGKWSVGVLGTMPAGSGAPYPAFRLLPRKATGFHLAKDGGNSMLQGTRTQSFIESESP